MNSNFWRGRRVLLTGHTGFKGAWLSLVLHRLGAETVGFALAPEQDHSLFQATGVAQCVQSIIGDIRDRNALEQAAVRFKPEVVFHLAAQALVLPSYQAPLETFATNVIGTANVLDVARSLPGVRSVVVVTSDKVYDNREWEWGYRESDSLGGRDPYSSSKACAEIVTAAYRESFFRKAGIAVATARAGNVIGGGDWAANRIIPDFARAALEQRPLVIRNPLSTRPWQHVLEPLAGYILLAERLATTADVEAQGSWNFGPPAEAVQPVSKLIDAVVDHWGEGTSWKHESVEQPHEARSLTLDSSKACQRLGWTRRLSFAETVRWTVDWYKASARGLDLQAITLSQIDAYRRLGQ